MLSKKIADLTDFPFRGCKVEPITWRAVSDNAVGSRHADATVSYLPDRHVSWFEWWPEQTDSHRFEVLNDCREMELVSGARKPPQSQAFETMMGLEVGETHLDFLSLIARSEERLRLHLAACYVAGVLIHIAHDPARKHVRAASRFEYARPTVEL
jgi:hypothetical protein